MGTEPAARRRGGITSCNVYSAAFGSNAPSLHLLLDPHLANIRRRGQRHCNFSNTEKRDTNGGPSRMSACEFKQTGRAVASGSGPFNPGCPQGNSAAEQATRPRSDDGASHRIMRSGVMFPRVVFSRWRSAICDRVLRSFVISCARSFDRVSADVCRVPQRECQLNVCHVWDCVCVCMLV